MVVRTVLAAAAVATVLLGCGGAKEAGDSGTGGGSPRKTEAAPDRVRANKAEIDWVGRVIEWAIGFSAPLEAAGAFADEIAAGKEIPGPIAHELERALGAIVNCAPAYRSTVGEPPSRRLETVGMTLEGACQKFSVGADAALEVLNGEPGNIRTLLLDEWKGTWTDAGELFRSASEELIDFQPANARELAVKEGATLETRIEPRFSKVASSLVDSEVEARCWSPVDWARLIEEMEAFTGGRIGKNTIGFTGFGDRRVNLAPEPCAGLVELAYESRRPADGFDRVKIALGVATLMHEAQHASGVFSEVAAECLGMQGIRSAAQELGADEAYAADLAVAYWQEIYPALPRSYRSPECRDGGRLDAHPKSPAWP
jgi:hypothetical protein